MHFVTARRVGAAFALAGVVLLVIAELTTVYEVTVGGLQIVKRSATGAENHGYALLVIAVVALAMTGLALRGARPPALALAALGVAALAIALLVDLPDTRASGDLPESLAYEQARARARAGLWLELLGGVLLAGAGGLLASRRRDGVRADAREPRR